MTNTINVNINVDPKVIREALDGLQLGGLGALLTDIYNNVVAGADSEPLDLAPKPREWDEAHEIPVGTVVKGKYFHKSGYSRPWIRYSEDHLHFNPRAGDENSKPRDRGHHELHDGRFGVADSVYDMWVEIPDHEFTFEPQPEPRVFAHAHEIPVGVKVVGSGHDGEWIRFTENHLHFEPRPGDENSTWGHRGHHRLEGGKFPVADFNARPFTEVVE